MYRSALVALNPNCADTAVEDYPLGFASARNLHLTAISVLDPHAISRPEAVPVGATAFKEQKDEAHLEELHGQTRSHLATFLQRADQLGVKSSSILKVGGLTDEISRAAQEFDIVITGHAAGTDACGDSTNVTALHRIMRQTPRPALVVPCGPLDARRTAVAYDGSLQAARALADFVASGLWAELPVDVLAVEPDAALADDNTGRATRYLRSHGYNANAVPILAGSGVAEHMLKHIDDNGVDLLVMGAYGKPTWQEFFFGTVTRDILHKIRIPVFISQ